MLSYLAPCTKVIFCFKEERASPYDSLAFVFLPSVR